MLSFSMNQLERRILRIGTRGSRLARWQAEWVAKQLCEQHAGLEVELVEIKTRGDIDRRSPLAEIGGAGLFTKEIQRAVRDHSVDIAVHSLKDLPTVLSPDLTLAAVTVREVESDALVAPVYKTLGALPAGAKIGTSSPRRRAQLLFLRPDVDVVAVRGNVETRLAYALEGRLDAIVLAQAGMRRLDLDRHMTEALCPPRFLPAVGQGALGIECRREDASVLALLESFDDTATRRAVLAERALLAALEGGCNLPLAAWARDLDDPGTGPVNPLLALDAAVFDAEGRTRIDVTITGPAGDPGGLGRRAAQALCEKGARDLLP
jgi:hydroxymethylbilane synthase